MKILITGVAGLLGSRLADWIIENTENEVIGVDDMSGGYEENVSDKVHLYKRDLSIDNIDDLFEEWKPDVVYHLAAYAAEGLSPFIRKFNYRNNLVSTANVINECIKHNVKRLVFTSSMAVYGHGKPPFHEDDLPCPIDPYGIAKYGAEMDIKIAGKYKLAQKLGASPKNVKPLAKNKFMFWPTHKNTM